MAILKKHKEPEVRSVKELIELIKEFTISYEELFNLKDNANTPQEKEMYQAQIDELEKIGKIIAEEIDKAIQQNESKLYEYEHNEDITKYSSDYEKSLITTAYRQELTQLRSLDAKFDKKMRALENINPKKLEEKAKMNESEAPQMTKFHDDDNNHI